MGGVGGRAEEEEEEGGCSPETLMLETSDAQLGVQAGGWESSFGDAVWVVMGGGGGWGE